MRRSLRGIVVGGVVALVLPVARASAQQQVTAGTVSPGMTRGQVVSALGEPITSREASGFTYIFYHNDCARTCGINDLVVLKGDSVVDAIFRSPSRRYTGKSSSPAPIPAEEARKIGAGGAGAIAQEPAPATPRMKPAPPNDVRPSIPTNRPLVVAPPPTNPAAKAPSIVTAKAAAKVESRTPAKVDVKTKVDSKPAAKTPDKKPVAAPPKADSKTTPPKPAPKTP